MSIDLKNRVGLHLDNDKWWTLRATDHSCLVKDSCSEYIFVDRPLEGSSSTPYTPVSLLLPLELML